MPVSCAYPGCFNIKRPKRTFSSGQTFLTFHRFPTHNPERLKLWLLALHLDINTSEHALICKRVCSDHFFEDNFKPSQQGHRRYLKASAVPKSPAPDSNAELEVHEAVEFLANVPQSTPVKQQDSDPGTTTRQFADAPSKLRLLLTSPESVRNRKTPSSSGIYFPLSSTSTSTTNSEEEECEMHWKQKKWIVNEPNVMELFKRCQECGSVITKTAKATVGSVLRVHWECEKKHKGKWSSCSDVRGMPANNLLVSALFATIYGIALQLVEVTLT
uniref:THAP-type domain-containing protein n=1 Tax=Cyprinus carpio carpio TaxID=630221 RepID=A0A8C1HH46_CYPCA